MDEGFVYKIVTESYPIMFGEEVTRKLAEGWTLYGSPYVFTEKGTSSCFCQAMIKGMSFNIALKNKS